MKFTLELSEIEVEALKKQMPSIIRGFVGKRANPPRYGRKEEESHWLSCESALKKIQSKLTIPNMDV